MHQAIDLNTISKIELPTRVSWATKSFDANETTYRLKDKVLLVEYNFTDLTGLEIRQAKLAPIVASRKQRFLTGLEEIEYDR